MTTWSVTLKKSLIQMSMCFMAYAVVRSSGCGTFAAVCIGWWAEGIATWLERVLAGKPEVVS